MNTLEKFFYISIGLAADISKRLENSLKKLSEQGKISELDAKKIINDFKNYTERYTNEVAQKFNEFIAHSLENLKLVKQKEVQELEKRIEKLEKLIEKL